MGGSGGGRPDFGGGPSGGLGGTTSGGQGGKGADDCSSLRERTMLASPQSEVLRTLVPGIRLTLQLTDGGPPVRAVTSDGHTAGTVMPSSLAKLVDCMQAGHIYDAEVVDIDGGACTVTLQSRTP